MVHFLILVGGVVGILLGNHEQYFIIGCVVFTCFLSLLSKSEWIKVFRAPLVSICVLFLATVTTTWSPHPGEICYGYITRKYSYGGEVSVYKCTKGASRVAKISVSGVGFTYAEMYTCVVVSVGGIKKGSISGTYLPNQSCHQQPWGSSYYFSLLRWGYSVRKHMQERAVTLSSTDVGTLGISILLGADGVNGEIKERMKYLGILHIMAISGINIRYLLEFVQFILSKSSAKIREISVYGVLVLLYVLAGPAVSLVRAVISVLCTKISRYCGVSFGNKEIYLVLWSLLIIDPTLLESYSYILVSFACFGIYIIAPLLLARLPSNIASPLIKEAAASVAVSGIMLPVQYWLFGTVSWLSGVVTFVLSPLVEVITIVGYLSLFLLPIPLLGEFLMVLFLQLVATLLFLINVPQVT